jgi:hypothetical protein
LTIRYSSGDRRFLNESSFIIYEWMTLFWNSGSSILISRTSFSNHVNLSSTIDSIRKYDESRTWIVPKRYEIEVFAPYIFIGL